MKTETEIKKILEEQYDLTNIETISDGGQSYSFKSTDLLLDRDIFVKVYWFSENLKDSLLAEPRRLNTLFNSSKNSRNHIANIYDASINKIEDIDHIFLKMEYCGNKNIGRLIEEKSICIHDAIDYIKQLCEGLHFLHSLNILHRDIKPENLVLNNRTCKLIDFGSTTRLEEGHDYINNTSIKTLNYTPPEYFQENRCYGKTSDIYQIGVVFHEILNGRLSLAKENISKRFLKERESQLKLNFEEFDNFQIREFELDLISMHTSKNSYLNTFAPTEKWIPTKITKLIHMITHCDISKRPSTCAQLRNELSNLVVPNWLKISDNEFSIINWKDKDFKIYKKQNKINEWVIESCRHGKTNFRKNSSLITFEDIISYINNA